MSSHTFRAEPTDLCDILEDICNGKIQLPEFQRSWVWDDDRIRDLLVSVARSFPVGAVMFLQTGGEAEFQTRLFEGTETASKKNVKPEKLVLDGQQRLTALTQALSLTSPVQIRTKKDKKIQRHYYFNIKKVLESPSELRDALVAVDENKRLRSDYGRKIELDLSTRELECQQLYFPCDQMMNPEIWMLAMHEYAKENIDSYIRFFKKILDPLKNYKLPVIEMLQTTPIEAVCQVFEKVNTGGVHLDVFDLLTATYAAQKHNLRDDWYGSNQSGGIKEQLAQNPLLNKVQATDFIQASTLVYTLERRNLATKDNKTSKSAPPVSTKRADVLKLPLEDWKKNLGGLKKGFTLAAQFLNMLSCYKSGELPYRTQMIPLAAILDRLGDHWREDKISKKLEQWFWCGAFGELYGSTTDTRIAHDYEQLTKWIDSDGPQPQTISDANFQDERFYTLRSKLSAAYKAISALVLRKGAQDWLWNDSIKDLGSDEVRIDAHHIFPKGWCEKHKISRESYESILNKTPISYRANRVIGGDAPSVYLSKLQKKTQWTKEDMDIRLESHALNPDLLRSDDYEAFIADRKTRLSKLISDAMGKPVNTSSENDT